MRHRDPGRAEARGTAWGGREFRAGLLLLGLLWAVALGAPLLAGDRPLVQRRKSGSSTIVIADIEDVVARIERIVRTGALQNEIDIVDSHRYAQPVRPCGVDMATGDRLDEGIRQAVHEVVDMHPADASGTDYAENGWSHLATSLLWALLPSRVISTT